MWFFREDENHQFAEFSNVSFFLISGVQNIFGTLEIYIFLNYFPKRNVLVNETTEIFRETLKKK